MAKCPNCNKDICSLYLERTVRADIVESYNASYNRGDNSLEKTHIEERDSIGIRDVLGVTYYCPECDSVVAGSDDEAVEFLKGDE